MPNLNQHMHITLVLQAYNMESRRHTVSSLPSSNDIIFVLITLGEEPIWVVLPVSSGRMMTTDGQLHVHTLTMNIH